MTWDGLEEVVAIADAGSFVGGAAILGVSTSHVSRAVARLEDRLDAKLFHRTTRRVTMTDIGRTFVDQCRRIVQERDELFSQASGSGEPQGELRITCSTALGERFVAPIVSRFTEAHPRLSVTLDLTNRLVDILGEGYDLGIRTGHVVDARVVARRIASRPIEVCAAPSYLDRVGEPAEIEDLREHQCLVGTSSNWHFLENGVPRIFTPRGRWRCNSGSAVVEAALAGMGVCQLPAFYVRDYLGDGRLRAVLQEYRADPEPIWAISPQRRHLMPKVRNLIEILETELHGALQVQQRELTSTAWRKMAGRREGTAKPSKGAPR